MHIFRSNASIFLDVEYGRYFMFNLFEYHRCIRTKNMHMPPLHLSALHTAPGTPEYALK